MPHEIHATDKSAKNQKANGKAKRFRAYLVQQKLKPRTGPIRFDTEQEEEREVMSYGDSVVVNGRVWVLYDATKTERSTLADSSKRVQAFLATHPNAQVCIGLGVPHCPTKSVEGL